MMILSYTKDQISKEAGKGTDWQDETFNYDAPINQHQVRKVSMVAMTRYQYFLCFKDTVTRRLLLSRVVSPTIGVGAWVPILLILSFEDETPNI